MMVANSFLSSEVQLEHSVDANTGHTYSRDVSVHNNCLHRSLSTFEKTLGVIYFESTHPSID